MPELLHNAHLKRRSIHLTRPDAAGQPCQQIVFGVDRKFLRHAAMVILSVIRSNPQTRFHFHLISAADLSFATPDLQRLIGHSEHQISLHLLDDELFRHLPQTRLFPASIYYRLLAPLLLAEHEQLLYLDADIICLGELQPLLGALDGRSEIVAAVSDQADAGRERSAALGLPQGRYFNSGVMLVNVRRWREQAISEKTVALLEQRGTQFRYPDQDALNVVLRDSTLLVEQRFNTIFKLGHSHEAYAALPAKDTVLLHYAGADKPWQRWNGQAAVRHYREIHAASPWATARFERPRLSRQAKRMYKLSFNEGHWLDGIYWFAQYLVKRYFRRN